MQGVAIGIFVKLPPENKPMLELGKRVFHADLWGLREAFTGKGENAKLTGGKYHWLAENDLNSTQWEEIEPSSPFYMFAPQDVMTRTEYEKGWGSTKIFERTLLGPNSHRDDFAIALEYSDAEGRIRDFSDTNITNREIADRYELSDNRDWKLSEARRMIPKNAKPTRCMYRPFDFRWMLYGEYAFDYPRAEINDDMLYPNFAIITTRQTKDSFSVLVTNLPVGQHKLVTPYDGSYVSTLYSYPKLDGLALGGDTRKANLSPEFLATVSEKTGLEYIPDGAGNLETQYGPEDVLHYIYAVLHSPTYRTRYAEFLKIDFPRIPVVS
jgi:Type ISP C-terminal specificity domain